MTVYQIQIRRGTAAEWQSNNPILSAGEFGYETDSNRLKIGDGAAAWNVLAYISPGPNSVVAGAGIDSLTEPQQAFIVVGTLVTTSDGRRWIYSGTGSKTSESSYVELADLTPDWGSIGNRPSTFPPDAHAHTTSQITDFAPAVAAAIPIASGGALGVVKIGANVTIDDTGVISVASPVTTLPYSSITGAPALATVATSGSYTDLTNTPAAYTLPAATASTLGGVKIGSGVTVAGDGTISVAPGGTLPVASTTVLGGVKQGSNVTIDGSGVLTANAPSFASITAKPTTLAGYGITDAPAPAQVVAYTTSGQWTKPTGARVVRMLAIGAGGGGGGGGNRAAGTQATGGGGGGGGAVVFAVFDASLLPASLQVTVAAGGAGGAGGSAGGNGGFGVNGGTSMVGSTTLAQDAWISAGGGGQGGGGTNATAGGGTGGARGLFVGGSGGATTSSGGAANGGASGGGGGGTVSTTGAIVTVGAGGIPPMTYGNPSQTWVNGTAGHSVPANAPLPGGGGTGGAAKANAAGSAGGAGGLYGGGGGGGGACTGAFVAGAGGAGGSGIVVITTYF